MVLPLDSTWTLRGQRLATGTCWSCSGTTCSTRWLMMGGRGWITRTSCSAWIGWTRGPWRRWVLGMSAREWVLECLWWQFLLGAINVPRWAIGAVGHVRRAEALFRAVLLRADGRLIGPSDRNYYYYYWWSSYLTTEGERMRGQNRWTDEGTSGTCINCDWTGRKEESGTRDVVVC